MDPTPIMVKNKLPSLAIDGAPPTRMTPMPSRALLGLEEKQAVMALFDEAIARGEAFGYNGPHEAEHEKAFAEWMGGGYADAVNSGTNAVYCALGALQLDALSEVIVPAITDPGGVMPVPLLACVPIVADCDPRSYNTNAAEIEAVLSPRTRAIIIAHIGGEPVDMDPVIALARRHNLAVIEDCSQSHGALYKGRPVGTFGDIAAFSTMSGKHHCSGAQGGMVFTRKEELYWKARRFADRGKPFNLTESKNVTAGLNCNSNELSAVIGCVQIRKIPDIIRRRNVVGESIKKALSGRPAIRVGWQVPDTMCTYWFLRIGLELEALRVNRDTFCQALAAEGIPVTPSYRHCPVEAPWFINRSVFGSSGFPWTAPNYTGNRNPTSKINNMISVTDCHFNLPLHERYSQVEIDDIVNALIKVETVYLK